MLTGRVLLFRRSIYLQIDRMCLGITPMVRRDALNEKNKANVLVVIQVSLACTSFVLYIPSHKIPAHPGTNQRGALVTFATEGVRLLHSSKSLILKLKLPFPPNLQPRDSQKHSLE